MAQKVNSLKLAFDTLTTDLATNTTLGTATRHDFAAKTFYCAESTGRTIRSVSVKVTGYFSGVTVTTFDGFRIGIKLGATAFDDVDVTGTGIANTGDPMSFCFTRDVTSYFVSNFGTAGSQTCQVGFACETAAASTIRNVTAEIIMTYEYDNANTTQTKHVRIPLEGNTGFLGTSANADQRGSSGAAQIPDLSTFLPESSKTIRQVWLEIYATDGGASTTDFTPSFSIDAGTTHSAGAIEAALNGSAEFYYIWDITAASGFDSNATNDFEAWCDQASRFERMYAILNVVYEYDPTSSTILNSIMVPFHTNKKVLQSTASGDSDVFINDIWIEEPTTITIKQSAVIAYWTNGGAGNMTVSVAGSGAAGGSQGTTTSTYTGTAYVGSGTKSLCHRIDLAHGGSAITLGRGKNRLLLKAYCGTANAATAISGYYILNYTSGKASDVGDHNRTTFWNIVGMSEGTIAGSNAFSIATTNQRTPNIPQTSYFLNSVGYELVANHASGAASIDVLAEIKTGELMEDGWAYGSIDFSDDTEWMQRRYFLDFTDWFDQYPSDPRNRMEVETARVHRIYGLTAEYGLTMMVTAHSITRTISGTVSGYVDADGAGLTVRHFDTNGWYLGSSTTTTGGDYTFTWYDNVTNVFSTLHEDSTHVGTSATDLAA